jgi:peptide chain release factor subunit 1
MSARPAQTIARKHGSLATGADEERMPSARALDRISRFHGQGLSVVSTYIAVPVEPDAHVPIRTKAHSLLHTIRSRGEDRALEHEARMSLREDMKRIEDVVSSLATIRAGTLAIFSCSGRELFELVWLPRAIRDRIMVDETPWIRPMIAILDEHDRCCTAVVDKESAQVWELYLGELRDAGRIDAAALRKHAHPSLRGLSKRRAPDKAEELARQHLRDLGAALDRLFREDSYDVVAVGGHEHELSVFLELVPRSLREHVVGTFSIDPRTATAATIRKDAEAILERHKLDEQARAVGEVLHSAGAHGLAAVGLEPCLWAGSVAAVGELFVQDGATAPGVVCDASSWFATSADVCPLCGERTRRTPDVIDELVEAVIDEGGAIHHVRADTELREQLTAARLRFALPPPAAASGRS